MRNSILISIVIIFSLFLLIGCSKASSSEMDHSNMDHSDMEDKPLPNTKDQEEVKQQEFSNSISYWHNKNIKGENVKIAVLDTGIDKDNKDLTYTKGINFVGKNKEDFGDNNGHGTKISGIIGARKNNYNLLGISPNSDLYISKVADENGNVRVGNLIKGINWAVEEGVDVINISLELPKGTKELHQAIKKAYKNDIVVISSSGNIKFPDDTDLSYPGAYSEVINVGILNTEGEIYSQEFKEKKVDVYAPGEDIISLYLNNKMTIDTGVSFSTAYTTGYTALLIQNYKDKKENYNTKKVKKDLQKYLDPDRK
ncbi:S8 family serine peptidase [Peribacillus sp. NPDC097206]|uniref:S8 family serine peptidase n=1 Tax=unclassified Peribacillus TaxID=2675266 RepID=UPI0038205A4F